MKYNGFFMIFVVCASVTLGIFAFHKKKEMYVNSTENPTENVIAGHSVMNPDYQLIEGEQDIGGDFVLTNHEGNEVNTETYRNEGKHLLIFFGFSHCPQMCPQALGTLSMVLRDIEGIQSLKKQIKVFFVTLDPSRDDVKRLSEFHKEFHPDIEMLTGDEGYLKSLRDKYKVFAQRLSEDEDYDINHSGVIYVMSPSGKIVAFMSATDTKVSMITKIKRL